MAPKQHPLNAAIERILEAQANLQEWIPDNAEEDRKHNGHPAFAP